MNSQAAILPFRVFALNPAGLTDPTLAIAACRGGAVGILNLETESSEEQPAREALVRLASFVRSPFGIKLSTHSKSHLDWIAASKPRPDVLVVDREMIRDCASKLAACRDAGIRIIAETTEWTTACRDDEASLDAWWLKGQEAGGLVGEATSFILLQQASVESTLPFYVRGGVNLHTVAACRLAGARGVVLDDQLLLARDSPLAEALRPRFRYFTGLETQLIAGGPQSDQLRVWALPGSNAARELAREFAGSGALRARDLLVRMGWRDFEGGGVVPLGQDGASAEALRQQYHSIARILRAFREAAERSIDQDAVAAVLGPAAPLAQVHGTRHAIVQGPMTHVSDRPSFVRAVAEAGGLPMFAVSLMRGKAVVEALQETKRLLGDLPWGVGLLGFVPTDTFEAQRAALLETRPPFAIIAGGRPDQSRELEQAGIATYLHVPSPTLLKQYLEQGCRHFIFEGRECGGHIGPLSSFALWHQMAECIAAFETGAFAAQELHVLLAGGIHDERSAAMAAAIAAPLTRLGVRVGILMGTGYIFTHEAVASGAITPLFQETASLSQRTVGLVTGPGHTSRCAYSPFVEQFWDARASLERRGASVEEIRNNLEELSLGRLRLASKGTVRRRADSAEQKKTTRSTQQRDGMFMIGQATVLRSDIQSVEELHASVSTGALQWLATREEQIRQTHSEGVDRQPLDIAIVGISCILPGAADKDAFWNNILDKQDAVTEIPLERWDWRPYFDEDRNAPDKIYSKWGGFIDDTVFDPTRFGMPPNSVEAIDPLQLLSLVAVRQALDDAGYGDGRPPEWERTSVILGFSGGLGDLGIRYGARAELPRIALDTKAGAYDDLPRWTEDSFAGLLPNVAAGRIANRFDFGGINMVVDAACASSLGALYQAAAELQSGRSDMVVTGGIDTVEGPFAFLCFSKAQALSPTGRCRTFDAEADGIAISEGLAILVLKRLVDAERDGDRIYAVLKGLGGSSDGKARGLMAPLPAGQRRALVRAYEQAGFGPDTVDLIEAHGTGTVAGDQAELEALTDLLHGWKARPQGVQVGSVKSLIGHTKATAGAAGLAKIALSLHHRVLPPHSSVETPNPALLAPDCPLYLSQRPRPWVRSGGHARRGAVSSFGFGGTNFHAVIEEYDGEFRPWIGRQSRSRWPAELFLWREESVGALRERLRAIMSALERDVRPPLPALARALASAATASGPAAAIVARSQEELRSRLELLRVAIEDPSRPLPPGVMLNLDPTPRVGKVAFLFSGQGAQHRHMLADVMICFREARETLEAGQRVLEQLPTFAERQAGRLCDLIYPPDAFDAEAEAQQDAQLTRTDVAQPALGVVEAALLEVVRQLGLSADMAAGHSYGEYVALYHAGALSFQDLMRVSEARGRMIVDAAASGELGTMAAVAADAETVRSSLAPSCEVEIANYNSPKQTILSGARPAIAKAVENLRAKGLTATPIPVAAAFHSKLIEPARAPLAGFIRDLKLMAPDVPVYSNTTARPHSATPSSIKKQLARHLTEPVRFQEMIERMYEDGARTFVEVGPKSILADLTGRILADRPHLSVALDGAGGGLAGLLSAIGHLFVQNHPVRTDFLYRDRGAAAEADLDVLLQGPEQDALPAHMWMLNGTRVFRPGQSGSPTREIAPMHEVTNSDSTFAMTDGLFLQPGKAVFKAITASNTGKPPALSAQENKRGPAFGNQDVRPQHVVAAKLDRENVMSKSNRGTVPDSGHREATMAEYYRTMRQFLQSQERLMLAYLANDSEVDADGWHVEDDSQVHVPAHPGNGGSQAEHEVLSSATPVTRPERSEADASITDSAETPAAEREAASPEPVPTNGGGGGNGVGAGAAKENADFGSVLLGIVSERTGYPEDMLALDADIEADLGIDSIKRVEILGAFRTQVPETLSRSLEGSLSNLTKAKSLQEILNIVAATPVGEETQRPFDLAGKGHEQAHSAPLSRFVIEAHEEDIDPTRLDDSLLPGAYIVTEDKRGVARLLCSHLERHGATAHILSSALLSNRDRIGKWLADIRSEVPIRGVLHLAPTDTRVAPEDADARWWSEALDRDIKSLFAILQLGANDLKLQGRVLTASAGGGNFLRHTPGAEKGIAYPGGAGNVGLIKALQLEWPEAICKAVDLDPTQTAEQHAAQLFDELRLPGGRREVGYPAGQRTIFRTVPASLTPVAQARDRPNSEWVVLAFGGARGITAETLRPIAGSKPTLVLVGRTPPPAPAEAEATRDLSDAASLRRHFIERTRGDNQAVRPAEIEAQVTSVIRERELRGNLDAFRDAGAKVDYRVADLLDEAQVETLLKDLYAEYGRIDAVWFGAGIIEDRLLEEKTSESFARVFDTKVVGALQVCRRLRRDGLKFVAFFTSVAGRYGNRGQTDYAAANEVLNRLAWSLAAYWGPSVKVTAVNWGPWSGTSFGPGMVSAEVRRQFEARGVKLVDPAGGREFVVRELLYAPLDDVEVVAGDNPWEYGEAMLSAIAGHEDEVPTPVKWPLMAGTRLSGNGRGQVFQKTIDLVSDPYLDDHRLDGVPVVPFVCCAEYMAEAASLPDNAGVVTDLSDIRLYRGLSLQRGRLPVEIALHDDEEAGVTEARVMIAGDKPRPAYRGLVHFAEAPLEPVRKALPVGIAASSIDAAKAYREWLFHGPRFQRITEMIGLDRSGALFRVRSSKPEEFYPLAKGAQWLFDPGVLDAALQVALVWSRAMRGETALPTRMSRLTRYGTEPLTEELSVAIRMLSTPEDPLIRLDFDVIDADGYLRLSVSDLQAPSSEKLNRVGGAWAGGQPKGID